MKEETIWEELDRFVGSIKDEIRSNDIDRVSIDFWLFKISRRIQILKKHIKRIEKLNSKTNDKTKKRGRTRTK